MKWFNNLKVSRKIAVAFVILIMFIIMSGVSGFISINSISGKSLMVDSGNQLINLLLEARRQEKNFQLRGYEKFGSDTKNSFEKWEEHIKAMYKLMDDVKTKMDDMVLRGILDEIRVGAGIYEDAFRKYIVYYKKDIQKEKELDDKIVDGARKYQMASVKWIDKLKMDMENNVKLAFILFAAFVCFGFIASLFTGIMLARSVSRPVNLGLDFAQKFSSGDLTARIDLHQKDEMGMLAGGLNKAAETLEGLVSGVVMAARNLAQAVEEISMGNQNLSQRTAEQASALEEIASTIEEATATTKQNSDNAGQANSLADDSFKLAEIGGNVSGEAVRGINEINDVSKKINDITSVINEISFQTNLLALNAAVEAARAGEAGRGFAVVAGEIRNLAQRSGNAAKQIESLIRDTISKIETGSGLVNKSGDSLKAIIEGIRNVSRIVGEINAASIEQKQGMDQLSVAITEMDTMTQQNAALVEETASASEEMANQAQDLLAMTKFFKITGDDNQNMPQEIQIKSADMNKNEGKGKNIIKTRGNGGSKIQIFNNPGDAKIKEMLGKEGFEEF